MNRIEREKKTLRLMIELYCHRKEKNAALCDTCRNLLYYAQSRLDQCKYGCEKCACKVCTTHCYTPYYRYKIREVMRYSGPWMLLYHPFATIRHLIVTQKATSYKFK